MCIDNIGPKGEEGPPGPPTLVTLLQEWIEEDPTLKRHFYTTAFREGIYIETNCPINNKGFDGWSLARIPPEDVPDKRIMVFHHGVRSKRDTISGKPQYMDYSTADPMKVRGYLRREDPQFLEKLREFLIKGHDTLYDRTDCRIKWNYGDLLSDTELYKRQIWWQDGPDL